ncbi:MAG: TIGR03905 family TSCPD domain-containing protein [Oscillospiraceae bacterium]|nr:TIGR03905 family TSCPD domain-containing protein [Oscillospiraceae bacterium]
MEYHYRTKGVCAVEIRFALDDDKVRDIAFTGGCNGNLKAIAKLCEGMTVDEIEEKLAGNTCGYKQTSCADQLARAVRAAYAQAHA